MGSYDSCDPAKVKARGIAMANYPKMPYVNNNQASTTGSPMHGTHFLDLISYITSPQQGDLSLGRRWRGSISTTGSPMHGTHFLDLISYITSPQQGDLSLGRRWRGSIPRRKDPCRSQGEFAIIFATVTPFIV
ncbi:hypothetical protein PoB_007105400 [Plakobranchus ocellatus]|uniref:Uncharacterized protein n=1 Tax=Plakobranchus ocellatus TaxID=259542 RepID=A0AAV4DKJ2_9GAST|nr:hypothetical protein PoB_007105400 [Plakobranchus ocellatus]